VKKDCSIYYGNIIDDGKDQYCEMWIRNRERKIREKRLWVDLEPPPHKDDF
jgi:hypothetical protein